MIVDAHAYITPGMHGRTRGGQTRSLPYGRVKQGEAVIQMLPPLSAEKTVLEPETMLRMMDWSCVDHMVLMQSNFYGDQNMYLHQAAKKWPDRFTATGSLDPMARDAQEIFRKVTQEFGVRILSFDLSENNGLTGLYPDLAINGPELEWVWEQAEQLQMVVAINLGRSPNRAEQCERTRDIIERHSQLKFVLTHLAHPPLAQPDDNEQNTGWRELILLARHGHVWLDAAGLPGLGMQDYPFPTALRYVRQAVDDVGAEKILWGSDIPGQLCLATYPQLLNMFALHMRLDDDSMAKILGSNAQAVYLGGE